MNAAMSPLMPCRLRTSNHSGALSAGVVVKGLVPNGKVLHGLQGGEDYEEMLALLGA
jgi:hypothetical protein